MLVFFSFERGFYSLVSSTFLSPYSMSSNCLEIFLSKERGLREVSQEIISTTSRSAFCSQRSDKGFTFHNLCFIREAGESNSTIVLSLVS
jgi:hypothetical protein